MTGSKLLVIQKLMNLKNNKMNNKATKNIGNSGRQFFRASALDFKKITGSPIAYWVSECMSDCYVKGERLNNIAPAKLGMRTGDNDKWLRRWYEISALESNFKSKDSEDAKFSGRKWFPYNKGGDFRRWYGNNEFVIFWENDGQEIKAETLEKYPQLSWDNLGWKITNESDFFKPSLTWSFVSSSNFGVRASLGGAIFDVGGSSAFPESDMYWVIAGFLCSKLVFEFLKASNPTLNFQVVNINGLPWCGSGGNDEAIEVLVKKLVNHVKEDWDSYETSWDFTCLPILQPAYRQMLLKTIYQKLLTHWRQTMLEMQRLEQENNRVFIDAYGLQNELKSDVPLNEITLTCNPYYRYGNNKNEEELETLLLADTMKELISYAVGCMFGRYSLDKPGLILANQGETIADYLKQIPEPIFSADDDNVIPMLDGDWFTDDVTERFSQFLKVTFGDAHYKENLKFIEQALGKNIRKYFLKDFYTDHLKRYKKRPIYWLFSSPKGTFNALIYMHRYRPDTVSVVLNDYLREFRTKLSAHKNHLEAISISSNASTGEKTKALKDIETHRKMIDELDVYEREVLYPLATEQVEIDLDDGVKVNYQKFGEALKKIPGLATKED